MYTVDWSEDIRPVRNKKSSNSCVCTFSDRVRELKKEKERERVRE